MLYHHSSQLASHIESIKSERREKKEKQTEKEKVF
jgi:hypothetical protein